MLLPKFISKLKSNCNLLLIKCITLIFLCIPLNNAQASGATYTIPMWCGSDPGTFCTPYFYTHMWVGTATSSTLFVPTITVYYDTLAGYIGYKGSVTLGSSGNNCDYIGATRFCARMADINDYGNNFACDSAGNSCIYNSSNSGCESTSCSITDMDDVNTGIQTCTVGDTYSVLGGESENYNQTYYCNNGGFYSNCCPGCRNVCSMRICAYQDPAASDDPLEQCDDIVDCMGSSSTSSNSLMPYFENEQTAYKATFGNEIYFNNVGGDNVGCVDVPLGPYPPPYCDPIIGSTPAVSVIDICDYSPEYELSQTTNDTGDVGNYEQISTSNEVCELSTVSGTPSASAPAYNVFEQPIARLYFNNALNICSSTYQLPNPPPPSGNDTCVQITSNLTPQEIWQNNESLIPVCSTTPGVSTENCVVFPSGRTTGPSGSSTQLGSDYQYFRTYFNEPGGSTPLSYGSDIASELSLFGIYDALYDDISDQNLSYSYTSTGTGSSGSSSYTFTNQYGTKYDYGTITLYDYEGDVRTYGAFIDLGCDPYLQAGTTGPGDGSQLCIDEINETSGNTPIGCYDRPWMFPPTVSDCRDYSSCSYDSSVNISDQPRISVSIGGTSLPNGTTTPVVTGVIGVDILSETAPVTFCVLDDNHSTAQQASDSTAITTASNICTQTTTTTNNLSPCTLYQSNIFSAYITDDINYSTTSDPSATNGTKTPYTTGEQYTGGMQYNDYIYCRGATQICLSGYNNSLKTVITKMVATTTNGTTTYAPSTILTDRIIPPYAIGETYPLSNTALYNPSVNNYYSGASTTNTYIGYYDSTAGTYIPGPGCPSAINTTENGITCCVSTDETTCSSNQTVTTYPASLICTCTNSTGESYSCDNTICNTLYQEVISTSVDGTTTTTTTSVDGVTISTTNTTTSGTGSSTGGVVTNYQIAGNYTAYTTSNSDDMPSPWTNCTYSNGVTLCPVEDDNGNPLFGVRELTAMELNLCVPLLTPYCDAIDSTDGYTETNGYATWDQTAAGATDTGVCIGKAKESGRVSPTRSCVYQDTTSNGEPVLYPNGCPQYTQVWGAVTNPCYVAPPWWPGTFLAGNANYQGAIINQFSVAYDYRSEISSSKYLTPKSTNADPFNLFSGAYNTQYSSSSVTTTSKTSTPIAPEPWNSCYGSCKKDGDGTAANYARTITDGDQEMLYLTQAQWFDLWNVNNDMEWLLASPDNSANDGCYVYSLCTAVDDSGNCTAANINANFAGITPAMKICKYQDNVSFALVDLGTYNSTTQTYAYATDYTNDHYLMQSNIIAYRNYISSGSSNVSVNNWCDSSSEDTTTSTYLSNNISDKTSKYDTRINNGIVVARAGFGSTSTDYDDSGTLPTSFVQCNAEKCGSCTSGSCTYQESVSIGYNFDHYYQGKHKDSNGITKHTTCNYYNPSTTAGSTGTSYKSSGSMDTYSTNTTNYYYTINPLAIFSNNMTLSSSQKASSYLLSSTFDSSYDYYYTPNSTSIWLPKYCDDDTNEHDYCTMSVVINSYTPGNSAANTAMFLWSSPTSYNITNGTVSFGSYGQPNE